MPDIQYTGAFPADNKSVTSLILVNLLPLFGVLFLKWDLASIIFYFWLENVVLGIINVFKLAIISPASKQKLGGIIEKVFLICFFIFHYGGFTAGHGFVILQVFGRPQANIKELIYIALSMFLSHGISFVYNFVGKEEYKKTTISAQMLQPYARIMIVHFTVLIGGLLGLMFKQQLFPLLVLITGKTFADVRMHLREHQKLQ